MMLWMIWATAVTALLGGAAWIGERALRNIGRQGRWAWAASIAGALALQVWSILGPPRHGSPEAAANVVSGDALGGVPGLFVEGIEAAWISAPALLERLDPYALVGWLSASAILLAGLLGNLWRLRRDAGGWAAGRVAGLDVLVSEDFGPALVGVWSPRIVVPRWALSLRPEAIRMACVHEAQHRAARDTWLLFAGALLVAATPWNAALWWQVVRLRQAIEVDCDKRVLNTGFSKSSYGALLLELGAHPRGVAAVVAALAQPTSLLERRLTMMMAEVKHTGPIRTGGVLTVAGLLVFAACDTPAPTATQVSAAPDVIVVAPTARTVTVVLPSSQTPTSEQARRLMRENPDLVRQRLLESGLSESEIRAQLDAAGLPADALDEFLSGDETVMPGFTQCLACHESGQGWVPPVFLSDERPPEESSGS